MGPNEILARWRTELGAIAALLVRHRLPDALDALTRLDALQGELWLAQTFRLFADDEPGDA